MKYEWVVKPQPPSDFFSRFPEYPRTVAQLLYSRGLDTPTKIDAFFGPEYNRDINNPLLLRGAKEACERIFQAIANKEKIVIYTDYDVDGVCGGTILGEFFKRVDYPFDIYIPDRQKEGHGLNQSALETLIAGGAKLVVTIDCGTTNANEVTLAKERGADIIVVDHHQVVGHNPPAAAFVNPHQDGDEYPFKEFCGTGLAFKLFLALASLSARSSLLTQQGVHGNGPSEKPAFPTGCEKWLLDLVALATVADMAPLLGENRVFVKYGLVVLAQTKRLGLKKLLESAGVRAKCDLETLSTNLDTITLGFALGPRLNAAGRMSHANLAYELLNTDDTARADELVSVLNENNRQRQQVVERIIKELDGIVSKYDSPPLFIVEGSKDWPLTLVGLAASRASEKYHRPLLLFQNAGDICKGSLRGIDGFNVMQALAHVSRHLIQYGGHPAAAGCSFRPGNENLVRQGLLDYAAKNLSADLLAKKLFVDAEMSWAEIDWKLADWLGKFAPFGVSNPKPRFLSRGVEIVNMIALGRKAEHLKMIMAEKSSGKTWPVLFFRHNGLADGLKIGDTLDVVYEVDVNEWNGNREIQLKLVDFNRNNREYTN